MKYLKSQFYGGAYFVQNSMILESLKVNYTKLIIKKKLNTSKTCHAKEIKTNIRPPYNVLQLPFKESKQKKLKNRRGRWGKKTRVDQRV